MATAFLDKSSLAQVIGTIFDGTTVRPLRPKYVFDAMAKEKVWDLNTVPTRGDVISFPVLSALSSNTGALDPTTTTYSDSQTSTYTRRTVSLTPYGDHGIMDMFESRAETFVDDLADFVFNLNDQAMNSVNKLARASMDLNKYSDETSGTLSQTYHYYGSYGAGSSTAGPLDAKTVREVVSDLRGDNVEPFEEGLYRAIITPIQYTQLRADSDNASWTETTKYVDNSMLLIGDVGVFEGTRFIVNNQNSGVSTGTISAYFMGKEFVGKAIGRDLQIKANDFLVGPQENLLPIHWNVLCGYKIIRREAGRIVETYNTQA